MAKIRTLLVVALMGNAGIAWAEQFDSDGVTIHYQEAGQGEPVVLIHGFRASGTINWGPNGVINALSDKYRVITLDNRGHGKSDKPQSEEDYGEKMADDVIRLLDHLKIDQAHLVGYSMGGMITLKLMAEHPRRVKSGVVGGMGWLRYQDGPPAREPESGKNSVLAPHLRACARAFGRLGITEEELREIQIPFVVVIGANDHLMSRVDALKQVRPDVPVVTIAGKNHVSCVFSRELRESIVDQLAKSESNDSAEK